MNACAVRLARVARVACAALLLLAAAPAAADDPPSPAPSPHGALPHGAFLHVSDIHFDPLTPPLRARALAHLPIADWPAFFAADPDQRLSHWGEDTNHALLASALTAIGAASADADFALVTGDLLAHRFPRPHRERAGPCAGLAGQRRLRGGDHAVRGGTAARRPAGQAGVPRARQQ